MYRRRLVGDAFDSGTILPKAASFGAQLGVAGLILDYAGLVGKVTMWIFHVGRVCLEIWRWAGAGVPIQQQPFQILTIH